MTTTNPFREATVKTWPDDDLVPPEILELVGQYRTHAAELSAHRGWLRQAHVHKREAEAKDVAATAAAITGGKRDPGPVHVLAFGAETAARTRKRQALEGVLGELVQQIKSVAAEHRDAWLNVADESVEVARQEHASALAVAASTREQWFATMSLRRWLASLPDSSYRLLVPPSSGLDELADEVAAKPKGPRASMTGPPRRAVSSRRGLAELSKTTAAEGSG